LVFGVVAVGVVVEPVFEEFLGFLGVVDG
jgi:hypothetical protein